MFIVSTDQKVSPLSPHTHSTTKLDWVAVPPNNILVVTPDLHLLLAPIGASAALSLALENIMSMERLLPQEVCKLPRWGA